MSINNRRLERNNNGGPFRNRNNENRRNRFNPYQNLNQIQDAARRAFALIQNHNLSTSRQGNFLETQTSKNFSNAVQDIKNSCHTEADKTEVYTQLYLRILHKISDDNIRDIDTQLNESNLSDIRKDELNGRKEFFQNIEKKHIQLFETLFTLINKNDDRDRSKPNYFEINSIQWLKQLGQLNPQNRNTIRGVRRRLF